MKAEKPNRIPFLPKKGLLTPKKNCWYGKTKYDIQCYSCAFMKEALAEKDKRIESLEGLAQRKVDELESLKKENEAFKRDMEKGVPDEVLEVENKGLKKENERLAQRVDYYEIGKDIEPSIKKAFAEGQNQALSELRDFVKERIKNCEQIREDRFDTASLSVGVRNKQFHRTAVKYKGMVIAFNEVLKAISSRRTA